MTSRRAFLVDLALLIVRATGAFMLFYLHGLDKVKAAYDHYAHGAEWQFPAMIAGTHLPLPTLLALFATFAEGIASLFMGAGLWTQYAATVVAVSMTGAIFTHIQSSTRPELAVLYWVISLLFVFHEPGRFAIDSKRTGRR